MSFSFLKKTNFKEIEAISETKAIERAAKELGIKITYKESKQNHILPNEYFKVVIVDLKNVPDEKRIKFEELQEEYQHQEYQNLLKGLAKRLLIYTGMLTAGVATLALITCENEKEQPTPKLIQKAKPLSNGYNYPYSHAREK